MSYQEDIVEMQEQIFTDRYITTTNGIRLIQVEYDGDLGDYHGVGNNGQFLIGEFLLKWDESNWEDTLVADTPGNELKRK